MPLHRRILIAGFADDPDWSATQGAPAPAGLVETIRIPGPGKVIWWGVGMNGGDANASPVDGTAATFSSKLIMRQATDDGRGFQYILQPTTPLEQAIGFISEYGRIRYEAVLPETAEAWLSVFNLAPNGPATHLWLHYRFVRSP